jgi:hypothetical protein
MCFLIVYLIFVCSCSYGSDSDLGSGRGIGSGPASGPGSGPGAGCGSGSDCSCWAWGVCDASVAGQGYRPQAPLVPVRRPRRGCWWCRSTTAGFPSMWIDAVLLFVPSFILLLYLINYIVCFRLRAAGLLPVARLVQGDSQRDAILRKDHMTRF